MDNKKLGTGLIIAALLMGFLLFSLNQKIIQEASDSCKCTELGGEYCPHNKSKNWQTNIGIVLLSAIAALGLYLIFFEKTQKEILSALEKEKNLKSENEKFNILMLGLEEEERKIMKAVREQDGITQQTLRLRTDLHKSKLSIILDGLEKKNLVKRERKGKTNQIFLKIAL